ncbi:LacI family DNA-binding transcriptional regulator [Tenacibaculum sp. C7A-26P2]|uniref:LacI family DNA-binding transcriptional regulator n=1 Tax=Tenacibaculum sp. C7A-26P2 TaxID=3447504 RepID=UPI003F834222
MKRLTIKDIAKYLNVSISTVSKALNDSYEISETTKERIRKFAKENNYRPNITAVNLKNKKTKTIGILIPNMLNYFLAQVFKGIETIASKNGYKIISCISNESYEKELEAVKMLSNGSIDGLILSLAEETLRKRNFLHFQDAIDNGIPIVMFDRVAQNIECDKVITNDFEGTVTTVKHLYKTGHKNIAFISTISDLKVGERRYLGYIKGLEDLNIPLNKNIVVNIFEEDYKKYETILAPIFEKNPIDSVITTDESSAIAAMKVATKMGYNIPRDFSVISFSNGILARHSSPKMTTVSQHGEIMGATAARMLINKLERKVKHIETKVIKTDLVVRESTRSIKY